MAAYDERVYSQFDATYGSWVFRATAQPYGAGRKSYIMRAYHTVAPTGYVYWESVAAGNTERAPYPVGELTDIVVVGSQE